MTFSFPSREILSVKLSTLSSCQYKSNMQIMIDEDKLLILDSHPINLFIKNFLNKKSPAEK